LRILTKENILFGAAGFSVFALNSIFITFSVLFFDEAGYSETQIGFMLSVTVIFSMLSQVVTGYLGDNVITIKKILLIDIVLTMIIVLLMIPAKGSYPLLFVLYAVFSITGRMIGPMIDGYITRMAQIRSALDFGFTRGVSSMGWAFASLVGGFLIRGIGIHMLFILHTVFALVSILVVLFLEDVPVNKKEMRNGQAKSESFADSARAVLGTRGFLITTVACFLMYTGVNTVHTYFSLIVVHVGGNSGDVGLGMFLLAMSEVPLLWNFYRIKRYFKNDHLIIFSIAMYVVKSILLIMFQNVAGVVWIQIMQGITYALFLPSILRFLESLLPARYMTTGIMIWLAIYNSGSQVVGSIVGGYLLEHYGIVPLYVVCGILSLAGAVLMAYALKRHRLAKEGV